MLLSDNRPEWHMTDLAVLDLGAVDVPIYGTLTPEQILYQARDSGAKAVVAENPAQMAKLLEIRDRCPELEHLVQIEGAAGDGVLRFDDLVASGSSGGAGDRFWKRADAVDARALMTLIYTSGTTGEPKGVMLTHSNLVANVLSSSPRIPVSRHDLALEFLPLCHVFERMIGYIYMLRATSKAYCSVYHVGDLMAAIQPTLFAGVPRFYEKVQQKIMDKVATASGVRRSLFGWALDAGRDMSHTRLSGREPGTAQAAAFRLADRVVLSKVRDALGGRIRFCISGGAELPLHVGEFFHALGIQVMEGYGLTETSPVIAVNGAGPGMLRLGTVGKPLEDVEIRLAEDGELLVRGPNVMQGYWNKPEQTREVIGEDGFFATGDIAELDDDGFLLIVDRKKDLIVTAGGKNVAPQPIESQLKRSRWVDSAVLIGDRRPFIVALLTPNLEEVQRWAASNGIAAASTKELLEHPKVHALFEAAVVDANSALARYEQIKAWRVLPTTLSIEDGHLTPTLKVKRRVVEAQFADDIEELYRG
jgi:long-chain acyl-CoA synthetase